MFHPRHCRLASESLLGLLLAGCLGCEPAIRAYELPTDNTGALALGGSSFTARSGSSSASSASAPAVAITRETIHDLSPLTSATTPHEVSPLTSTTAGLGPAASACGNGQLDANEECDSAIRDSASNPCRTDCTRPRCGDAVPDPSEACDDGNGVDNDGCSNACKLPRCGDSILQVNEACDDGNSINDDSCSNQCSVPGCGDGVEQKPREECDDGNLVSTDGCTAACKLPKCGDGFQQTGEECDDGNSVNTDACSNACKKMRCGDNVIQLTEECDDGNSVNGDACTATCKQPRCGDGILSSGEGCEDGNQTDGDGCSSTCQSEICGDAKKTGAEQCDDGNKLDNDGCSATCRNEVCGDGVVQTPREDCEDLNTVDTDVCRNGCKHAASLNALSSSCSTTDQITQTVCMVAVANWCKQYNNSPLAGMVTGQKADNEYSVGCISGFQREEVATSMLGDQCGSGRQQSPSCLEQIAAACRTLGYSQGFYLGTGSSSSNTALACGNGTTLTESVSGCNGIAATSPVPVDCAKALAAKCGSNKGGMLQQRAQSNQVTYTCVNLTLTGSVRQH